MLIVARPAMGAIVGAVSYLIVVVVIRATGAAGRADVVKPDRWA
jgi:hypothetical protein